MSAARSPRPNSAIEPSHRVVTAAPPARRRLSAPPRGGRQVSPVVATVAPAPEFPVSNFEASAFTSALFAPLPRWRNLALSRVVADLLARVWPGYDREVDNTRTVYGLARC